MSEFYVSRQSYWHENGAYAVEIARELDYSGPGALVSRYSSQGEGCEFSDPREAAEAAIAVREAWLADLGKSDETHNLPVAITLAMNDLVYPVSDDGYEPDELREWAAKRAEAMPRCEHCGDICETEDGYWVGDPSSTVTACCLSHAEAYTEQWVYELAEDLGDDDTEEDDD